MVDARRAKRQKRILENSKSCLERFSSLQKDQRHVTEETEIEDNHSANFQSAVCDNDDEVMIDHCNDIENIDEKSNFERTNKTLSGSTSSESPNIQGKADSVRISTAKHSEQRNSTSNSESYETIYAESNESSSDASLN